MDASSITQTLLTVGITLISVTAGAFLNDRTARSRESRLVRSEGEALRMLLDLEIHSNLTSLRELYGQIIFSERTIGTIETAEDITIGPSRLVGNNAWSQQSTGSCGSRCSISHRTTGTASAAARMPPDAGGSRTM